MKKILKRNYKYGIVTNSQNREFPEFFPTKVGTFHGKDIIEKQNIETFEDLIVRGKLDAFNNAEGKIFQFYEILTDSGDLKWVFEGQIPRNRAESNEDKSGSLSDNNVALQQTQQEKSKGVGRMIRMYEEQNESLKRELQRERDDKQLRINEAVSDWSSKYQIVNAENVALRERLEKMYHDIDKLIEAKAEDAATIAELKAEINFLKTKTENEINTLNDNFRKEKEIEEKIRSLIPQKKSFLSGLMDVAGELKQQPEMLQIGVELAKSAPAMIREAMIGLRGLINKDAPMPNDMQLPNDTNNLEVL